MATALFFFVWGVYVLPQWRAPALPPPLAATVAAGTPVVLQGLVCSRPVETATGDSFLLDLNGMADHARFIPVSGRLLITVAKGQTGLMRGDLIRCGTRISIPHRLGIPGEHDYVRHLSYQGVAATGWVASPDAIILVRGGMSDSLLRRVDGVARKLGETIRTAVPDQTVSSVLAALLIGDQKRIPDAVNAAYTRAGVNHILSISGFHIGIIAYGMVAVCLAIMSRFEYLALRLNLRSLALLLAVPAMLAYLLLTGSAPATARSVLMLAIFVLALYAERETDPVNGLLIAAFVLLIIHPPDLFDISFQLSFLALWGIVLIAPWAAKLPKQHPRIPWNRVLIPFVAASCAATAATVVPLLYHFGQASFNGIIANFIIVPLLGYGAVLSGFCVLPLVYLVPAAAHWLLWCAAWLTALSNWLVSLFAGLPVLAFHGVTRFDMACLLAVMGCLTLLKRSRTGSALSFLPLLAAVAVHLATPGASDGRLHVVMLSVGQGESLVIRLPDGRIMLVDGGGYLHDTGRDFGQRILAPALWKLGVQKIDYLVLTHSHPDHIGGMPFIAGNFPVGEFWESVSGGVGPEYAGLRAILSERHVPRRVLRAGDRVTIPGNVVVSVLSPQGPGVRNGPAPDDLDLNEGSLVFRLTYGSFSMLFTGDIGFAAEAAIMAHRGALASTVLKVGHHGSRYATSDSWLDRVRPEAALISAGYGNRFGLPAGETLSRLRRRGILTRCTARDGTIELVSDGVSWHGRPVCPPD